MYVCRLADASGIGDDHGDDAQSATLPPLLSDFLVDRKLDGLARRPVDQPGEIGMRLIVGVGFHGPPLLPL